MKSPFLVFVALLAAAIAYDTWRSLTPKWRTDNLNRLLDLPLPITLTNAKHMASTGSDRSGYATCTIDSNLFTQLGKGLRLNKVPNWAPDQIFERIDHFFGGRPGGIPQIYKGSVERGWVSVVWYTNGTVFIIHDE